MGETTVHSTLEGGSSSTVPATARQEGVPNGLTTAVKVLTTTTKAIS